MTSNQFDFFEGSRTESKAPQVTVRRSGQMVLTPPAVAMLGNDVTHVQFGFDAGSQAVALRAASNGAKGRYRLRAQSNGASLVDGRRFLAHHGVTVEKARSFPAEAFGDGIVGFRFGEAGSDTREAQDEAPAKADTPPPGSRPAPASARPPPRRRDHDHRTRGGVSPERRPPPLFVWTGWRTRRRRGSPWRTSQLG